MKGNHRYYIPESFENPYFTGEEIKFWNNYLKENYRIWIYFKRITLLQVSNPNITRYSARSILWLVRTNHKISCLNAISRYLGFMYNTESKTDTFKLK